MQAGTGRKGAAVVSILLALSLSAAGAGEPAGPDPAALVPSSAVMYAASSRLELTLPAAAYVIKEILPASNSKNIIEWRDGFRERTGIDVFSADSLARADVDVKRPAAVAYLKAERDDERIMILIPVKNPRRFPLRFVDIMKRFNRDKPRADLNPAVTRYKKHAVYQMQKDIFFTAIGDYFLVAPSGRLVTAAIDIASGSGPAPLAGDPLFRDYRAKSGGDFDLSVYMKKEFFDEIDAYNRERRERLGRDGSGNQGEPGDGALKGDVAEKTAPRRLPSEDLPFLDYMCLSVKTAGDGAGIRLGFSLKKDDPVATVFSRMFKTGLPSGGLLFLDNPLSYYYLSFDLSVFEDVCGGGKEGSKKICETYNKMKESLLRDYEIDVVRDFIPYHGGFINAAIRKTKIAGRLDSFVIYMPLADQNASFYRRLKAAAKKRYGQEGSFGEERVDALPSFWYKDEKGNRISTVLHETGLYVGNNTEFLREGMAGKGNLMELGSVEDVKRIDRDTFMFFYFRLDSESYLKAIMMLLVQATNPRLAGIVQSIDRFSIIGRRIDSFFSVELSVSVSHEKKKTP